MCTAISAWLAGLELPVEERESVDARQIAFVDAEVAAVDRLQRNGHGRGPHPNHQPAPPPRSACGRKSRALYHELRNTPRTRTSMPDRVRVGLYEAFRRLAGNGPPLRILVGDARRPDIAVEPVSRAVGADRVAGPPSARRTATRCSTQALARPTRLSKHLGR
jgi:hypothetical protein